VGRARKQVQSAGARTVLLGEPGRRVP